MEITTDSTATPTTTDSQINENNTNPNSVTTISSSLSTASLTLSLSSSLPSHFFTPSKTTHLFSPKFVKIPSQITSSLTALSLSTNPSKPTSKISSFSASTLQSPLFVTPRRPSDPSNGAAARRAVVVWFRNDLRLHDNECIATANNESTSVLPLYCFDPRDYGKSTSGFDKTGPYRASFLIESVSDLRKGLQARGSDLIVRIGKPESVIVELAKTVGADAVYVHREVSNEEAKAEARIENALKDEGVGVKYFWGSTLYHLEDLPFKLEEMPINYGGFRENVQGLKVRETIAALEQLKGLPSRGDVQPGDIPSLADLGINPNATLSQAMSFVSDVGSHNNNDGPPKCFCGIPVAVVTSWTAENPGRRFEACKVYNPSTNFRRCKFFRWIDRPQCDWQRDVINKLVKEKKIINCELKWMKEERKKMVEEIKNLIVDKPILDVVQPLKSSSRAWLVMTFFAITCSIAILFGFM